MGVTDRKERARTYRFKSDEAYYGARDALVSRQYRNVCNRAWYSVMQIVTAATYEDMNDEPSNDRPNWAHERQGIMFRNFLRKHKVWEENKAIAVEIDLMRERRNDADYYSPKELHKNKPSAEKSLEIAEKVRNLVYQLIGDRWNWHGTDDFVEDGAA